jgi:hypothetical protein
MPLRSVRLGVRVALVLALGAVTDASAARALAYPASWPMLVPSDCGTLRGTYEDLPRAVEDAGQRISGVTLSSVLGLNTGEAMNDAREARAVGLSVDDGGAVAAGYDGVLEEIPGLRCADRPPRATLERISMAATYPPDHPLAHLRRIGIRAIQPLLYSTPTGDLVVSLRVTRRERRLETFGYPAVDQYWLWYRRVADSR